MRRAIFLDRDGVLNEDRGFTHKVADLVLLPGVAAALRTLKERGFRLVVVSNQSGVARGLYDAAAVVSFHVALDTALIAAGGVAIDAYYFCPHGPEGGCVCRKPAPGMILQAMREHGLERAGSWLVGDRESDVAAAAGAGVRAIQVVPPGTEPDPNATQHAASLADALRWLI